MRPWMGLMAIMKGIRCSCSVLLEDESNEFV